MQSRFLIYCFSFFLIFSCKKDENLIFKEVSFPVEDNIVSINVPEAQEDLQLSKTINSEILSVITSALHIGDPDNIPQRTIEENISFFNAEFNQFKSVFPESALQWEAQIDGEVIYQSPEIICIALTAYVNTGGAHGNNTITLLNFNKQKATLISNDSIFNNLEGVLKLVESTFKNEVEYPSDYFFGEAFHLPANVGFSDEGIIFLYNTYEIAPYSAGITELIIPFNKISSYLNFE